MRFVDDFGDIFWREVLGSPFWPLVIHLFRWSMRNIIHWFAALELWFWGSQRLFPCLRESFSIPSPRLWLPNTRTPACSCSTLSPGDPLMHCCCPSLPPPTLNLELITFSLRPALGSLFTDLVVVPIPHYPYPPPLSPTSSNFFQPLETPWGLLLLCSITIGVPQGRSV